jgi:hypothetical protein
MHIVPKYKDGYGFGGVFEMNPQKIFLSDAAYIEVIEKIKAGLTDSGILEFQQNDTL